MFKKCTCLPASYPLKWNWPGIGLFLSQEVLTLAFWKLGLCSNDRSRSPTVKLPEQGGSCRKSEPGQGEGRARMRGKGLPPAFICDCLLGAHMPPCLWLAKWNSWLGICIRWLFSQLLQLFDEGRGRSKYLSCGPRCHLIQLLLVSLRSAQCATPACLQGCQPTHPTGHVDWRCTFSKCYFQKAQMKES